MLVVVFNLVCKYFCVQDLFLILKLNPYYTFPSSFLAYSWQFYFHIPLPTNCCSSETKHPAATEASSALLPQVLANFEAESRDDRCVKNLMILRCLK